MRVNGGISSGASKVFALSIENMLSVALNVTLGQSKVKDEDAIGSLVESDAEVIRLDVTVDEMTIVDVFDTCDHLVHQH